MTSCLSILSVPTPNLRVILSTLLHLLLSLCFVRLHPDKVEKLEDPKVPGEILIPSERSLIGPSYSTSARTGVEFLSLRRMDSGASVKQCGQKTVRASERPLSSGPSSASLGLSRRVAVTGLSEGGRAKSERADAQGGHSFESFCDTTALSKGAICKS